MILVDTSVWISHFRHGSAGLEHLLLDGVVLGHPLVIGELACGQLKNRRQILSLLASLPQAQHVENVEALHFIEAHHLMGIGLGLIDIHLLASAALTRARVWTVDKKLAQEATKLNVGYSPTSR